MGYQDILERIAGEEQCSKEEVEREMLVAIQQAGLECSVEEFIASACKQIVKGKKYNKQK